MKSKTRRWKPWSPPSPPFLSLFAQSQPGKRGELSPVNSIWKLITGHYPSLPSLLSSCDAWRHREEERKGETRMDETGRKRKEEKTRGGGRGEEEDGWRADVRRSGKVRHKEERLSFYPLSYSQHVSIWLYLKSTFFKITFVFVLLPPSPFPLSVSCAPPPVSSSLSSLSALHFIRTVKTNRLSLLISPQSRCSWLPFIWQQRTVLWNNVALYWYYKIHGPTCVNT